MSWTMQLKIKNGVGHPDGEWQDIAPSGGEPYRFESEAVAQRMLDICYPDQFRKARLGAEPIVRIHKES